MEPAEAWTGTAQSKKTDASTRIATSRRSCQDHVADGATDSNRDEQNHSPRPVDRSRSPPSHVLKLREYLVPRKKMSRCLKKTFKKKLHIRLTDRNGALDFAPTANGSSVAAGMGFCLQATLCCVSSSRKKIFLHCAILFEMVRSISPDRQQVCVAAGAGFCLQAMLCCVSSSRKKLSFFCAILFEMVRSISPDRGCHVFY